MKLEVWRAKRGFNLYYFLFYSDSGTFFLLSVLFSLFSALRARSVPVHFFCFYWEFFSAQAWFLSHVYCWLLLIFLSFFLCLLILGFFSHVTLVFLNLSFLLQRGEIYGVRGVLWVSW
ncbi:hypothetical protein DFH27DRAFT_398393 [Peziza echinospora]|nr:hypothetical protein DFH27DRAFT_398393 [Peziza echinospora]